MKLCGENIRKVRRSKDFTQEYMTLEMGISQKAYSDLENSKVKVNLETLQKIAEILNIKPSDICSISGACHSGEEAVKYDKLLAYLKDKGISVPEQYL